MSAKEVNRILFRDLIQACTFGDVEESILRFYPGQKKNISGYQYVFETLRHMRYRTNKEGMTIRIEKFGRGKNQYVDVSGKCATDDHESYALEYTSWAKWLGYDVDQTVLKKMTKEDIVAHCLWEMTFIGFTQNKIKSRLAALNKQVKDLREGRAKTFPYEGMMALLKSKVKDRRMRK